MTYITRADLMRKWGVKNVTAWAKRDGSMTAADVGANIDAALEAAEAEIAGRLDGSIYGVPLVESTTGALRPLKEAMIDVAASILAPAGEQQDALVDGDGLTPRQRAHKLVDSYLSGAAPLAVDRNTNVSGFVIPELIDRSTVVDVTHECIE